MKKIVDHISWKTVWRIDKFKDPTNKIAKMLQSGLSLTEARRLFAEAFLGTDIIENNCCLNEGLGEMIDLICGLGTPTKWDNTNARLGIGDSNTAADPAQTGLQALVNKTFKAVDATWPQRNNQTVEWRATFGSTEGNHGWQEMTVVNAADDSGKNLNRKVQNKDAKVAGETWTLALAITFS